MGRTARKMPTSQLFSESQHPSIVAQACQHLIRQDAEIYRLKLAPGESLTHDLAEGRGLWLQVIQGPATLNETELHSGDAGIVEEAGQFQITATKQPFEALLFDLK